jgi:hypothetical protein
MVKLRIEGEPDEIAAFLAHVEEVDGLSLDWATPISKRAAHHHWGSALAGVSAELIEGLTADYSVYQRGKKKGNAVYGWVYLLPAYGKEGLVGYKIGKTLNPFSRRTSFGNKLYFEIEFIALISTDDHTKLETTLHRHFAAKRMARSEFFTLAPEDVLYIQQMMNEMDRAKLAEVNAMGKR